MQQAAQAADEPALDASVDSSLPLWFKPEKFLEPQFSPEAYVADLKRYVSRSSRVCWGRAGGRGGGGARAGVGRQSCKRCCATTQRQVCLLGGSSSHGGSRQRGLCMAQRW